MFKLPSVVHFFTYLTIMTTALSQPGAFIYNAESGDTLDNWLVINDGVMGGLSLSTLGQDDEGHLHFSGRVSLENNGGFCSVRHTFGPIALSGKASIVLRIKGDGKRYQFRIKGDSNTYYNYITYFETSGEWETITLRLDKLNHAAARDQQLLREMQSQYQKWQEWDERCRINHKADERIEELRWSFEELRVSLFAQELKTEYPISLKRLEKRWKELGL